MRLYAAVGEVTERPANLHISTPINDVITPTNDVSIEISSETQH